MRITRTRAGCAYLHIWRTGQGYERQKGPLYRSEWTNLHFSIRPQPPQEPTALYHDVREPLPYANECFDAVYAFHILEHLTPAEATAFAREVLRVLKPSGIARFSTPDLEDICRSYLRRLEEVRCDSSERNRIRHHWSILELLDQLVREQSGGLMSPAVGRGEFDPEFARERYGDVFDEFWSPPVSRTPALRAKRSFSGRLKGFARQIFRAPFRRARAQREARKSALQAAFADPRQNGEINKWMYDEVSLRELLEDAGFCDFQRCDHRSSMIPDWERYDFDRSTHGDHAIEPSLYAEARKR